jgi:hypothetical protein
VFGCHVHLVGVAISFEKIFYQLSFTPPSLVASSVLHASDVSSLLPHLNSNTDTNIHIYILADTDRIIRITFPYFHP